MDRALGVNPNRRRAFVVHCAGIRRECNVKHIVGISRSRPCSADAVQDIICEVNDVFGLLLEFKGGISPFKQLTQDKCALPDPGGQR